MLITRNIVPRVNDTGQIGINGKRWEEGHFGSIYADNLIVSGGVIPAGAVFPYAGIDVAEAPAGYLFCHGGDYDTGVYASLFAAIGHRYGGASTTFYVPDYRGVFLRARDGGRGVEPLADRNARTNSSPVGGDGVVGDNVGTYQEDVFKSHYHRIPDGAGGGNSSNFLSALYGTADVINSYSTGGNETRPVNMSVTYIIKY